MEFAIEKSKKIGEFIEPDVLPDHDVAAFFNSEADSANTRGALHIASPTLALQYRLAAAKLARCLRIPGQCARVAGKADPAHGRYRSMRLDISTEPEWAQSSIERKDETQAAKAVALALQIERGVPVSVELWDEQRGVSQVDYMLTQGTRRIALEVTTVGIERDRTDYHHWIKRGPRSHTAAGLVNAWMIVVDTSTQKTAAKVKKKLPGWLRELEARSIFSISAARLPANASDVERE